MMGGFGSMKVAWREVPEEPSGVDASPPRVLVVTSMYPSAATPSFGIFVKRQVEALKQRECGQEVLLIDGRQSRLNYLKAIWRVRRAVRSGRYDLVHAYYGLCGFVSAWQSSIPLVITYCGSDLNPGFAGRQRARLKSRVIIALGQIAALRASVCLVRSREMRGRLLGRRARDRARIVTSGVDLDLFQPGDPAEARRRLGWERGKKVVLFVCSDEDLS